MKKSLKMIGIFLICLLFATITTNAKSYVKELFQAGDKVNIDNELDGTSFIAGNIINVNKSINGIGFIAGNELLIKGNQKYIFGAGASIKIDGNIENDLFLAGQFINISENSVLGRDTYIVGEDISIDGTIQRNLYIAADEVTLKGTYNGNVTINSTKIELEDDVKILGTLKYNEDASIGNINDSILTKTYKNKTYEVGIKDYIYDFISSYLHITLLAIILIYLFESVFTKSLDQTKNLSSKNILILCGKGLLILIGIPIIAFTLLFSGLFVSVGLVGGLVYGIFVYISNIFTAYFIANIIDKKWLKKNMNSYLLIIVGLLVIYILKLVPILGGLISFISLVFGLGIIGNMIIDIKK